MARGKHKNAIVRSMRSTLFAALFLLALVSAPALQPKTEEPIYPITAEGIKPPKAIFSPEPDIPKDAHGMTSTRVMVSGYVAIDGKYRDGKILRSSGEPSLDTRALETLKKWKFHPCRKDGKAVNCELIIEVTFNLTGDHK
jgi:protein TonB